MSKKTWSNCAKCNNYIPLPDNAEPIQGELCTSCAETEANRQMMKRLPAVLKAFNTLTKACFEAKRRGWKKADCNRIHRTATASSKAYQTMQKKGSDALAKSRY